MQPIELPRYIRSVAPPSSCPVEDFIDPLIAIQLSCTRPYREPVEDVWDRMLKNRLSARTPREEFLGEVQRIPGILRVESSADHVRVVVADRYSAAGRAVRELEFEIMRKHPDASLDVWLSEEP